MRSSGSTTEPAAAGRRFPWPGAGKALFSLAVIAATAWFFAGRWPEVAARLQRLPAAVLPLLVATALLNYAVNALRNRLQLGVSGVRVGVVEALALTVCNSMFNYLPARGGAAFQAVYLRERHGFPFVRFLTLGAVLVPLYTGAAAAFAGVLLLVPGLTTGPRHPVLAAALVAGALLGPAGLLAAHLVGRVTLPERFARLGRWIELVQEGEAAFRGRPGALAALAGLYLLSLLVFALRFWIIFRAIGHPAPYPALCVVQSFAALSTFVALTPGSLGVKEAVLVVSAGLLGIATEPMMAAALVDRAVSMALVFPLGGIFGQVITRLRPGGRPGRAGAAGP